MMQDPPAVSSGASSTPLDAFCALVLADHSQQKQLLQPDFTNEVRQCRTSRIVGTAD
jgi:hypothetical protein